MGMKFSTLASLNLSVLIHMLTLGNSERPQYNKMICILYVTFYVHNCCVSNVPTYLLKTLISFLVDTISKGKLDQINK